MLSIGFAWSWRHSLINHSTYRFCILLSFQRKQQQTSHVYVILCKSESIVYPFALEKFRNRQMRRVVHGCYPKIAQKKWMIWAAEQWTKSFQTHLIHNHSLYWSKKGRKLVVGLTTETILMVWSVCVLCCVFVCVSRHSWMYIIWYMRCRCIYSCKIQPLQIHTSKYVCCIRLAKKT